MNDRYSVIAKEDLAVVSESLSGIYRWLDQNRRPMFKHDEILVLYSQYTPTKKMLEKLAHACQVVDIDKCFIMLETNEDISGQINELFPDADEFSKFRCSVSENISSRLFDEHSENLNTVSPTICALPWSHLEISETGKIYPCCKNNIELGDVRSSSVQQIIESETLGNIRKNLISGNRIPECDQCWKPEKDGLRSMRQDLLLANQKKFFTEWIEQPKVRRVDLKVGNVCNFKCRICNPYRSSQIAAEIFKKDTIEKKQKILEIAQDLKWFDEHKGFIEEFKLITDQIENLNFYGGEPFLSKNLELLLDTMIDSDHSHKIKLHFNTNGSIFPENLIEKLQRFQLIDIGISIDDIGPRFDFQRTGEWTTVSANVKKFASLDPDIFNVYLFPTISILNIYYLDELLDWAEKNNVKTILKENAANILVSPWYFCIDKMTNQAKELVFKKYSSSDHPILKQLAKRISTSAGSDGLTFCSEMKKLDVWREENFSDHHKDIALAMGYLLN